MASVQSRRNGRAGILSECEQRERDLLLSGHRYAEISALLGVNEREVRHRNKVLYKIELLDTFRRRIEAFGPPARLQVTAEFGYWLSGLFDGEGHFGVQLDGGRQRVLKAHISLRDDDASVLDRICRGLGCGVLYCRRGSKGSNPECMVKVQNGRDAREIVVPLFEKYPLFSKKKEEFEIWKKIVHVNYIRTAGGALHVPYSPEYLKAFDSAMRDLDAVRPYHGTSDCCSTCSFRMNHEKTRAAASENVDAPEPSDQTVPTATD